MSVAGVDTPNKEPCAMRTLFVVMLFSVSAEYPRLQILAGKAPRPIEE